MNQSANALVFDDVENALVVATLLQDTGQPQNGKLLGNVCELAFVYDVHDVVHAKLALREQADDPEPRFVRDKMEQRDHALTDRAVSSELFFSGLASRFHQFITS